MSLYFRPMDAEAAQELLGWRYPPPYDIYNVPEEADAVAVGFIIDPRNCYYRIDNEARELVAFCCFGEDGRVLGGDYSAPALDIGLGVRPDLTGQGRGGTFVAAVCEFAQRAFAPVALRVTIAAWNGRAQRVWQRAGFAPVGPFTTPSGLRFIIYTRHEPPQGHV